MHQLLFISRQMHLYFVCDMSPNAIYGFLMMWLQPQCFWQISSSQTTFNWFNRLKPINSWPVIRFGRRSSSGSTHFYDLATSAEWRRKVTIICHHQLTPFFEPDLQSLDSKIDLEDFFASSYTLQHLLKKPLSGTVTLI